MAHEDYKAMMPAYALSALDAAEERAFSQHLSECAECQNELAEWESTAASLALSASAAEPSPQVRERIMNAIREEKVVQFPGRRSVWTSFGSLGAIAAAVLFVALIIGIVVLWQQNRAMQRELAFARLATTPGAKMTELSGTEQATGATAKIAYDKTGHAMLMASGLPPAPQGKEYQLWFIVGNKPPMPGKSFAPDSSGQGTLTDQMPREAMDSAVFAITLEPAGGMRAPTGEIYLRSGL
jgi:anti-sigma-K factor RskA